MNTTSTSIQLSDRRRGPSIFVRQVALYLVLILLVVGVAGRLFFNTARTHLEAEVGGKLESVARIATRHTPIERLDLIRVGDDQSRMVLRLKQRLEEIREETGLLNLYVFRPDRTSLLDLDPTVAIGTVYDLPQLGGDGITSLRRMPSTHTLGYVTPSGAIRMSAFAAITDSAGTLAAIVGVGRRLCGAGDPRAHAPTAVLDRRRMRRTGLHRRPALCPQHHPAGAPHRRRGRATRSRRLHGARRRVHSRRARGPRLSGEPHGGAGAPA